MKKYFLIITATLLCLCSCDVKPAKEEIANTGAANFTASFEVPQGMSALWEAGEKVVVVDSKNNIHRFDMDTGADKTAGEFSGTVSEDSQIKFVAFSHNTEDFDYDAASESFTFKVASVYNAKAAGALVSANNAALGTLQGSEVALKSVCGFIKFILEPNGKTLEQGGRTYELTDIREITFTANDGKSFAGIVHASWPEGAAGPVFDEVENGSSTITFHTRTIATPDGDIFYEAGEYYIPVAPQNYEDVTIKVVDTEGNAATAVAHRAIDVQLAMQSNLNAITWPTIVIEVKLQCASKTEEQSHAELSLLPSSGLAVDRVNNTTGVKESGAFAKKTEYPFTEAGLQYSLWSDSGAGRWTASVGGGQYAMCDLCFAFYNAKWSYQSQSWTAGYQNNVSWIKFPAYNGILTKVEIFNYHNSSTGAMSLSTEVDPETGIGNHSIYYTAKLTGSLGSFQWDSFPVANLKKGEQLYFCMEGGHTWRIRGWKLYYKVYE